MKKINYYLIEKNKDNSSIKTYKNKAINSLVEVELFLRNSKSLFRYIKLYKLLK